MIPASQLWGFAAFPFNYFNLFLINLNSVLLVRQNKDVTLGFPIIFRISTNQTIDLWKKK